MKLGFIGLGKMGKNLVLNLLDHAHTVVVYNRSSEPVQEMAKAGAVAARDIRELVEQTGPAGTRVLWVMVTAGPAVDAILESLGPLLSPGDVVIDGGNSRSTDTLRRAKDFSELGVLFLDIGTSGGLEGARHGACLMVGGDRAAFERLEPLFKELAVPGGYAHCGPSGSGHYVKMVHNGVEYGMMASLGEGFELMRTYDASLDLAAIARVWNHGSVVRGWLVELLADALARDPALREHGSVIGHSGEGKWTVEEAVRLNVPAPAITAALFTRFESGTRDNFNGRVQSALRYGFGGHVSPGR